MVTSRAAAVITSAGLIIFGLASSIGILGLGGAFDHTVRRFQPTCQAPPFPGSMVMVTLTNMGMAMMPGRGRSGTMRIYTDQAACRTAPCHFEPSTPAHSATNS